MEQKLQKIECQLLEVDSSNKAKLQRIAELEKDNEEQRQTIRTLSEKNESMQNVQTDLNKLELFFQS